MESKRPESKEPDKPQKTTAVPKPGREKTAEIAGSKLSAVPSSKQLDPSKLTNTVTILGDVFDKKTLEDKSKQELIDMIFKLNKELVRVTTKITEEPSPLSFEADADVGEYKRLPETGVQKREGGTDIVWRIKLTSSESSHKSLGLDIHHDVVIGRKGEKTNPHLDLTEYDALDKGISRQHALLRPTGSELYLIDLKSTNGTAHHSSKLEAGVRKELNDGDVISFGQLHFKVNIIKKPEVKASPKTK